MSCSPSSSSSCGEQHCFKTVDSDETKDGGMCTLSCLVTSCLCTSSRFIDSHHFSCVGSKSSSSHPFLRSSLFSNVPPTVQFYMKGSKVTKPNKVICSRLTWCHNSLLPIVMRQCLSRSHFTIVDQSSFWIGYWGRHLKSNQYRTIQPFQKVNHFPGAFHMGRKDRLWQHINEMMVMWGANEYYIMPTTYILPRDFKKLSNYLNNSSSHRVIVKPPASARGTGITITNRTKSIPVKNNLIAQHYIDRPLIINGTKFDLRLYVYITSLEPLRIYLYNEGLVRFASVPYSTSPSSLTNKFMHLTNYSINKLAQSVGQRETPVPKWKLTQLWDYVADYIDVPLMKRRIVDIIIKTVLACEKWIRAHQKKHSLFTFTSHELYGMDILIDDNLKPWLLEVNISPSLHSGTAVDQSVKAPLARDVLNLCGIQLPPQQDDKRTSLTINYGVKPFEGHKTHAELEKERYHVEYYRKNGRIDETILDELTGSDARVLVDFEDELSRANNFDLIFPTCENIGYMKYYNEAVYANLLLMQWQLSQESRSDGRHNGIQILDRICKRGDHMSNFPIVTSTTAYSSTNDVNTVLN
ncbi:unnamed protein product [Anisakis simplex]|uniref:Tubulin polyglutamylase ttll-4 (inferred by orthology to a C. elegans protein) n=1 Tax=Anisakis simplex TaxID=6269 RepID=A0A0M3K048_ANISI|nr:unnamed protein product [Anisakis simplex]